jgi:hypothetical protein
MKGDGVARRFAVAGTIPPPLEFPVRPTPDSRRAAPSVRLTYHAWIAAAAAVEEAALRVLRSRRYLLGPETAAFEAEMARMVGVREAVGVSSGTQSLVLALRAGLSEPAIERVCEVIRAALNCG